MRRKAVLLCLVFLVMFVIPINNENISESFDILDKHSVMLPASLHTPHIPIVIESDEDFVSQGWPGKGTEADPYVISWLLIENYTTVDCIKISNTRSHFVITECLISSLGDSIKPDASKNGIDLNNVSNVIISYNVVYRSYDTIKVWNSDNIIIRNNVMMDANPVDGKLMSIYDCNDILVEENQCYGYYYESTHGMILAQSEAVRIYNNGISNVKLYGLGIAGTNNCNVTANNIYDCDNRGLYVYESAYDNYFNWNRFNTTIAENIAGVTNVFHRNHWTNYVGVDLDGDGIGDSFYNQLGIEDKEPVMVWDGHKILPTIDSPEDEVIESGSLGNEITWDTFDLTPSHYEVYEDGLLDSTESWDSGFVTVNIDGLEVGNHDITLVLYDSTENIVNDTVFVLVTETITTTTTTTDATTIVNTTLPENEPLPPLIVGGIILGGFVTLTGAFVIKKYKPKD
jgi:parallel beta-helix repeat protein